MFNDSKHRRLIWKREITKAEIFPMNLFFLLPDSQILFTIIKSIYRTISTRSLDLTRVIAIQKLEVSFCLVRFTLE